MGFGSRQSSSRLTATHVASKLLFMSQHKVYVATQRNQKMNKRKNKEANHKKSLSDQETCKYIQTHNQRNAILKTEIPFYTYWNEKD